MQIYLFLVPVLLPLAHGFTANNPFPIFASCDEKYLSNIKTYWGVTGSPKNVLKTFEKAVTYYMVRSSYDYHNDVNKCVTMDANENYMNFTFIRKDNGPNAYLNYTVTETLEGVILGTPIDSTSSERAKWKWYSVVKGTGILVNYVCSDSTDSNQPPLTVFWVSKKSFQNVLTKTLITSTFNFMKLLGFPFKYSYGDECFSSKPSTGSGLLGLTGLGIGGTK